GGPADTGEEDIGRAAQSPPVGFGHDRRLATLAGGPDGRGRACRQVDGNEGGAVAVEAGIVGVAGALIDASLAAEFGVHGLHRQAVALHAAVAAPLADRLVDDDPGAADRLCAPLTQAPGLGRALLVVDEHRDALDAGQHLLRLVEPVPV